jgi:hypothetical protein
MSYLRTNKEKEKEKEKEKGGLKKSSVDNTFKKLSCSPTQ